MTDFNSKLLPTTQPELNNESDQKGFDVAASLGASINESLMMPSETLAAELPDLHNSTGLSWGNDELASETSMWQKQIHAAEQKIRQNPYPYIAGALGLGLVIGKILSSGRSHSV